MHHCKNNKILTGVLTGFSVVLRGLSGSTYEPKDFVLRTLPVTFSTVLISSFLSVSLWMISSCLGKMNHNSLRNQFSTKLYATVNFLR